MFTDKQVRPVGHTKKTAVPFEGRRYLYRAVDPCLAVFRLLYKLVFVSVGMKVPQPATKSNDKRLTRGLLES